MSDYKQLNRIYQNELRLPYDNSSKLVFMSDCHRGDGSGADNFRENKNILLTALRYYNRKKFTYFELGDGDELWACKDFSKIASVNSDIFDVLTQFYNEERYYVIYGNHDMVKKNKKWVKNNLSKYMTEYNDMILPLFPEIKTHEGIVLVNKDNNNSILLIHGHQVDIINDDLWRLSRFLVRYLWRPLEIVGIKDPISPTNNPLRKGRIDSVFINWSVDNDVMIIAGHTHRTVFPKTNEPMYFNDGCSVYPNFITAIEIETGGISLVKWSISVNDNSVLTIIRTVLKGPRILTDYFGNVAF